MKFTPQAAVVTPEQQMQQKMMEQQVQQYRAAQAVQASRQVGAYRNAVAAQAASRAMVAASQSDEIVGMGNIFKQLDTSSQIWMRIDDSGIKALIVQKYIDYYRNKGVSIHNAAQHYVDMIDSVSKDSPSLLDNPFGNVLKFMAIIEYDFNNGQDKDQMAKSILGEKMFVENRKRFGK